jgi:MOSC domain-containing protein YiiM
MSIYVAQSMITGWYYRVLEAGFIREGDAITLLERQTDRFSIRRFWEVQLARRPAVEDLLALASLDGLTPDWKRRMRDRAKWQRAQP